MHTLRNRLICLAIISMIAIPAIAAESNRLSDNFTINSNGTPSDVVVQSLIPDCNLINFEGFGDNMPIGLIPGSVNVTFGSSWLGLIDADDGGSGNIANEPSSNTVAYFLDLDDISIALDPPVQFVEFWYVASAVSLPLTITAFDGAGNVVDSAEGTTLGTDFDGADCVGDPTGQFCLWGLVSLNAASNNIASVEITGSTANQFAFDNMQFCTETQELVGCCLDDLSCISVTAEGCYAAGGAIVDVDCANADCATVSTDETTWDSLKSSYR